MCQGGKASFFHDKTHKMRYNRSNIMQEAHTMSTQTRVVRLLQNTLYPTYQLHATMSNKQTTPAEGLRFAALTVMEWLRQRIGEDIPQELVQPEPERYKEADDSCLPSLHIHRGYVVDIVSLPSQGVWSLQITEPNLGSEPGTPAQQRQAVPGRVIETNIGFCIQGKTLECGFQTVISDPVGSGLPSGGSAAFDGKPCLWVDPHSSAERRNLLSQKHGRAPEDADPYHRPRKSASHCDFYISSIRT